MGGGAPTRSGPEAHTKIAPASTPARSHILAPTTTSSLPSPVTSATWMPWPLTSPSWSFATARGFASTAVGAGTPARPAPPNQTCTLPASLRPASLAPTTRSSTPSSETSARTTPWPLERPSWSLSAGTGAFRRAKRRDAPDERGAAPIDEDRAAVLGPDAARARRRRDHVEDAVAGDVGELEARGRSAREEVARHHRRGPEHRRRGPRRRVAAREDVDRARVHQARGVGEAGRRDHVLDAVPRDVADEGAGRRGRGAGALDLALHAHHDGARADERGHAVVPRGEQQRARPARLGGHAPPDATRHGGGRVDARGHRAARPVGSRARGRSPGRSGPSRSRRTRRPRRCGRSSA